MANIRDLKEPNGNVFYPLTHERAVKDSNGVTLQTKLAGLESKSYVEAWDGTSTPVEANIPAGVTVTYNTTTYTGALEASASTIGKIYLVKNGSNYDRYITSESGDTFSWAPNGSTQMDLSGYATETELAEISTGSRTKEELIVSWSVGYVIYSSGEISENTNYTNAAINVEEGQIIQFITDANTTVAVIAAFDSNGQYVIGSSVAGTGSSHTYDYIVPAGITRLIISGYNSAQYKHIYKFGPLYSALGEYTDERVDDLQAKLLPITKSVRVPVDADLQLLGVRIPTIIANSSVSLGVSGDVVVETIRVDGNVAGENRSNITAIGQTVTYTPTVDITELVLYLRNVTSAGTIYITVDYGYNVSGLDERMDEVDEKMDELDERLGNETDCYGEALDLVLDSGFLDYATGSVRSNENYLYTSEYLPVKIGEKYAFLCDHSETVGSVMAYDENHNYLKELSLAGSGEYRATTYVVPAGVSFLRFSLNNTENLTKFISKIYSARKTVKDELNTKDYLEGQAMADGEDYFLEENYHKTNWIIQANIREIGNGFSSILVGKGLNYYRGGMAVKITPTHVQTVYDSSGWYLSEEHGLNIGDYLDVRIESYVERTDESPEYTGDGDATYVRITLFDGSTEYTIEKAFFTGGGPALIRINGATAKADLYYWCTDLKRDLWCYGDSYFSIAQTRWPYWIITRGFNALWNANPGANSQFMWANFARDLQHGNPRKVFWCLGMNDKDADGAPNTNWSRYLQRVKDICRLRGIELIMATIPNVPSTAADNTYKNQAVRNSGYKYVDFDAAVMKPDGTGWYDGMMMDETHPSKTGARCLANAAMKLLISYKNI